MNRPELNPRTKKIGIVGRKYSNPFRNPNDGIRFPVPSVIKNPSRPAKTRMVRGEARQNSSSTTGLRKLPANRPNKRPGPRKTKTAADSRLSRAPKPDPGRQSGSTRFSPGFFLSLLEVLESGAQSSQDFSRCFQQRAQSRVFRPPNFVAHQLDQIRQTFLHRPGVGIRGFRGFLFHGASLATIVPGVSGAAPELPIGNFPPPTASLLQGLA